MNARLAPAAVVATLLVAAPAAAGGFVVPDIGVRRTAMASIVGRPDDGAAVYHNPAGLILQHGWHAYASAGVLLISSEFQVHAWDRSDEVLGTTAGADGYYDPVRPSRAIGAVPMLALSGELLPDRLVVAASLYVANAQGAAFSDRAVSRYHLIDGYVVAPQATLAASYRVSDALAVGASVGVMYLRLHGHRLVFPVLQGTDLTAIAGTKADLVLDGSGWAPTWIAAAFGQPHPRVTWGATVAGRIDAELQGPLRITYGDDAPTPGDTLVGTQTTTQLVPWTFTAGAAVDLTPQLELGVDVRYWLYRQYRTQHTDVVGIFLVKELETVKNYHDSYQPSGGLRLHDLAAAPGLELMAGTHYDHSPAPPTTLTLDQPSFDHLGLHAGARWSVGRYRLGASYVHYWYAVPTVTGSTTAPPTNFRGSGGNNIFTVSVEARL